MLIHYYETILINKVLNLQRIIVKLKKMIKIYLSDSFLL